MLVTPSEFNIIKVPESNDPVSLLIHSSSILQSSYRLPFLILHLASPLFTHDDLQRIVKLKMSHKTLVIYFTYFSTAFSYTIEESNDIFFNLAFNSSKMFILHNSPVSPCITPLPSAILSHQKYYSSGTILN